MKAFSDSRAADTSFLESPSQAVVLEWWVSLRKQVGQGGPGGRELGRPPSRADTWGGSPERTWAGVGRPVRALGCCCVGPWGKWH